GAAAPPDRESSRPRRAGPTSPPRRRHAGAPPPHRRWRAKRSPSRGPARAERPSGAPLLARHDLDAGPAVRQELARVAEARRIEEPLDPQHHVEIVRPELILHEPDLFDADPVLPRDAASQLDHLADDRVGNLLHPVKLIR